MNLRTKIRRWWIGPALYDRAVASIELANDCEAQGRRNAERTLARIRAEVAAEGATTHTPPAKPTQAQP